MFSIMSLISSGFILVSCSEEDDGEGAVAVAIKKRKGQI